MVPHHHHEFLAYDFPSHIDEQHNQAHHNHKHHHPHDTDDKSKENRDTKSNHDHSFPIHQHFFSADDIQFIRLNVKESGQPNRNTCKITFDSDLFSYLLFKPPDKKPIQYSYWNSDGLKYFYFCTSNPLRAPPYLV
jgi:hypothetical protein